MTKKEKDAEKFAKNMLELEQHLGRDLRPDEVMLLALFVSVVNASEEDEKDEKDVENKAFHINGRHNGKDLFYKKVKALEQRFERELRPDERMLLASFDSIKVTGVDGKDENLFSKKAKALEQRLGRELRLSEALLIVLFDSLEVVKADEKKEEEKPCGQAGNWLLTLLFLAAALGIDPGTELETMQDHKKESEWTKVKEFEKQRSVTLTAGPVSEDTLKDLFKPMNERCCDKKEEEND